jgi:twinkle protein
MYNIKQKLIEEGIHINMNNPQQKTLCPKCSHKRKNNREPCLSVNIENDKALWHCHHCEWEGGVSENNDYIPKQKVNNVITLNEYAQRELDNGDFIFLKERMISDKTIQEFGLYTEKNNLCFPYRYEDKIVNIKYRSHEKRFYQVKDAVKTLYNIDKLKENWNKIKSVIFAEGEIDCLSLYECGYKNVVSLPDGAPKEAKYNDNDKRFTAFLQSQWIFDADEVIIATDNDQAGRALSLELIHRFGKDICKVVEFPEDCKDANEVLMLHGKDELKNCISNAKAFPIKDIHTAKEYKSTIQDMYDGNVQKAISTGFEILDQIYKVMPSTFNLITGIPNHGKSNFLDQLLMNLAEQQNWKFVLFSPEHSTSNHLRRLLEKRCRKPFDIGVYERIDQNELNAGMDFLDQHFKFIESQDEIPDIDFILRKAKVAKLRYGINGLVIDPFNQISSDRTNNKREDEHIRDIIAKCQQFARNHQIAVWMVAHPHKLHRNDAGVIPPPDLYQVSGSAHWANMSDTALVVHRDFEENSTKIITRKIREQGVYGEIGFRECSFNYITRCYQFNK